MWITGHHNSLNLQGTAGSSLTDQACAQRTGLTTTLAQHKCALVQSSALGLMELNSEQPS